MMKTWSTLPIMAVSLIGTSFGQTVNLNQVLLSAVAKASAEDARVEVAQNQLRLLESQNKWKLELRPTLGVFAFSNPVLLAANLGGSLLTGRRGAPSPQTLKNAQLDLVAAELNAEYLKVRTEINAARDYFDLLAKQQIATTAKTMVESRKKKLSEVESLLKKSKVTLLDKMTIEQEVLELEQYALEADTQREIAAGNLAFLIGFKESNSLVAQEVVLAHQVSSNNLPEVDQLLQSAMVYRKEPGLIRTRIDALRKQLGQDKKGNSLGRSDLSFSITLKDNGEKQIEKEVIAARLKLLEMELSNMEQDLRKELQTVRAMAAASGEKLKINTKRMELAERRKNVLSIRAQNGLDGSLAGLLAAEGSLAGDRKSVEAAYESKASVFTLMVLCGIQNESAEVVTRVLGS